MDPEVGKPTLRTAAKYFLLQLPGAIFFVLILFLLRNWVDIPSEVIWILIGMWLAKDLLLFPLLWRSYDSSRHNDRFDMVNRKGYALSRLAPKGYVQVLGERWRAVVDEGEPAIEKGEVVCVIAVNGLELTVISSVMEEPS